MMHDLFPSMTAMLKMNQRISVLLTFLTHLIFWIFLTGKIQPIECSYPPSANANPIPLPSPDLCSSCRRGDNSSCRVVAGIFTRPQLTVGYNVVAHIPRGACNLNITEIRQSPNHLALRKKDGSYIFNGEWRLSQSGEYEGFPGTKVIYKRQDLKSLESVVTRGGPLEEQLDLVVLYQQPNPGIKYEYMLPSSSWRESPVSPLVPLVQDPLLRTSLARTGGNYYSHHHPRQPLAATSRTASYISPADISLSSSSLQQLPQPILNLYNSVSTFPVKNTNLVGASSSGHSPELYPAAGDPSSSSSAYTHSHNNGANNNPPPSGPYHHTNHHHHRHLRRRNYGAGGTGPAASKHSVPVSGGSGSTSPAAFAMSMDKKFYWETTGYTDCSEPCGGGMQRSIVRCVRGSTGNAVSDRRCSLEEKPPVQIIRCNLKPCPAEWVIGNWSTCAGECGLGQRSRSVHCQQRVSPTLTMRVAEGACLQQRPEAKVSCALKPCNRWNTSEWSQCSTNCGNGIRKRTVTCVGSAGDQLSLEECDQAEKPAGLTPCNMGPCVGVSWFVSEWSPECSQRCGSGIQTRHVVCTGLHPQTHHQNETNSVQKSADKYYTYEHHHHNHHQHYNNGSIELASELELATNLIEESSGESDMRFRRALNESVGGHALVLSGTESSSQSEEKEADGPLEFYCDESQKPQEERECFSDRGCVDPVWFTGNWGKCSSSCGSGIRTRQVLCVLFTRGRFKITSKDGYCRGETKPAEKEACESNRACLPRWFTTEWGECSALCGGGIQKRSVSCRAGNWTQSSSRCSDEDRPIEKRSCNEHKCTLIPAISSTTPAPDPLNASDRNEIVKDEPTGKVEPGMNATSTVKPSEPDYSSLVQPISPLTEEADEFECMDEYRNCALVVQARLCRYKYYRSVCCHSCSDAPV